MVWFRVLSSGAADLPIEPLGQSSRLTSVVISEIMYHPLERADGKRLEFIELFNTLSTPEDLSGYRLEGDVRFVFPAGTVIPARGFLVVARAPTDVASVYNLQGVLGPFEGGAGLPNDRGRVELRHRTGALFLEVNYESEEPWPASADVAGHSLVLARPSYGEGNMLAWEASRLTGGSPGALEPAMSDAADAVKINEFLAHTDAPELDFVELYNHGNSAVDLGGYVLSDDAATNKFAIPAGTTIPARGFLSFTEAQLGFALSSAGERIFLKTPVSAPAARVVDAVRFGGQGNGISMGRVPNGAAEWHPLESKSPGAANGAVRVAEVVINEIMYHPIFEDDDEQFVELFNRGGSAVNVGGWRLEDGISYTIPANTTIPAGGYLVIARDVARLLANHANLTAANVVGGFYGRLAYSGERIALSRPDFTVTTNNAGFVSTNFFQIVVDEVTYGDGGNWGQWSDGGGSSLERVDARADSRRASNWADSDETKKAGWTTISRTGRIDHGTVAADQLQMFLQGSGEALVDDVQVLNGSGANLVPNSTFEGGVTGWTAEGTQDGSGLETSEGYNSARSYHVRAVERGDNQLNRIRVNLTSSLAEGSTGTIKARVRWLRGHPEILFRLRGNWLDAGVTLDVPKNLGTPGARNSRAVNNGAPAIYDVAHSPVVPAASQAVVVTAKVSDPDGVRELNLRYRVDPSATLTTLTMNDTGSNGDAVAGDGIFSGRIPGQSSGRLVAYHLTANDHAGAASALPASAPAREFLVRFGEPTPTGTFPVYRIWMTQATFNTWSSRPKLNNTPLPITFVLGNFRAIQNSSGLYAGSPYISGGYNTPAGNRCGYTLAFPADDRFLDDTDLVLDWPGGHGNERTAMQEQMAYWMTDLVDLPYSHRYWIRLQVNGVTDMQRGTVFEAVNQPAGDFLDAWLPEFEEIDFYKIDRAFEFSDSGSRTADPQPRLENYTTVGGEKKLEKYRWTFMKRAYESANDYSNIFSLVDALNAPSPEPYTSQSALLIDLEEWMGILAMEHIIVNFDAYGHQIGKNMYAAKPEGGKWELYMFDLDWLMLAATGFSANYGPSTAPLFNAEDPTMVRMYNHPPFRRAYFRKVKKAVDGPMRAELCNPVMDAKHAALVANGITMCDGQTLIAPTPVKTWFAQRRTFLLNQLNAISAPFAITSNSGANFSSNSDIVTLTGTAPIEVVGMRVNGVEHPVTWTTVNQWSIRVALRSGVNTLNVQAYDADGVTINMMSDTITVNSTASAESPAGKVMISEIMFNPAEPEAEFIELHNHSSTATFDVSGWRLNGADLDIPNGTLIAPGGYLVFARDAGAFTRAHGNEVTLAGEFDGNLDRGGETLSLLSADGSIVDVVTYDAIAPWAVAPAGASLQLIDPAQDNYRVANWGVSTETGGGGNEQPQWRFVSSTGTASSSRLYVYMNSAGEVHVDDLKLVAGSTPELGANQINNGGFEEAFPGPWNISANLAGSATSTAVKRSGARSLRIVSTSAGTTRTSSIWQDVGPLTSGETYTLSYWYLPSTNGAGLTMRLSGAGINHTENISPESGKDLFSTPGAANSVARVMPPLPQVWINEIQPRNVTGAADNTGEREPWLELYNAGETAVLLDAWQLLAESGGAWKFPAGTTIGAKQFLTVWMDGEAAENAAGSLHASFRLAATNGYVALSIPYDSGTAVLDYARYSGAGADRSIGFFPDGTPGPRRPFFFSTPGAANNDAAQPLPVFINEWMPANTSSLADPADDDFDDWFELYNPNTVTVDLGGYFLADSVTSTSGRWRVPAGVTIPAGGFLLVWADNETGQNSAGTGHLHAGFRLSQEGEAIAVFAPNGTLIDAVEFGTQTNNISQGRSPDGSTNIMYLASASPAELNVPGEPVVIELLQPVITGEGVTLQWTAESGRRYEVLGSENLASGSWTVVSQVNATGSIGRTVVPIAPGDARSFFRVVRRD